MKIKNKILIILTGFLFITVMNSCDEYLEVSPVGALSNDVLSNEEGIEYVLIAAYSKLNGENPPDVVTTTPIQAVPGLLRSDQVHTGFGVMAEFVSATKNNPGSTDNIYLLGFENTYEAINRCNQVITLADEASDLSDEQKTQYKAEARFLRGHYYFTLWSQYRNIPWVDETTDDVRVKNYEGETPETATGYIDISNNIIDDFKYAMDNLADSYTSEDIARPNSYAAEAYYAKALIYQGNYAELEGETATTQYETALSALNDVISNGVTSSGETYGLQEDYQWNFNPDHENSKESVFAVQCSVNDGTSWENGTCNIVTGFWLAGSASVLGGGRNLCQPTQWFVDCFRTNDDGLPYLDMYETNSASIGSDDGVDTDDEYTPDTTTPVDPRLDITVGRRAIPFLDFGGMPGTWAAENRSTYGPYLQKKWQLYESQYTAHVSTDVSPVTDQNMDVIRYADVLLFAAEMEARVGTLENAKDYVNQVRERMIDNEDNWVKTDAGDNASNYVIGTYDSFDSQEYALEAILFERNLEFGLEGNRFFDLVRFGKVDEVMDDYYATEGQLRSYISGVTYDETDDDLLPIPNDAITSSLSDGIQTLKQNPGY